VVADRKGAAFLACFDVATEAGHAIPARVRSVACRPASAWLDVLQHRFWYWWTVTT
jgi:hypothetical protein